ncbi:MAG TPA: tetratricopeptide repeat protein [Pyrinomonadaceae bacterium]
MLSKGIKHYCQKCLAANPLGQELCLRCGTRLMLVVEPPAARFEEEDVVATHEEHLLERISALENNLSRLTDRFEQALDLLLRQAQTAYNEHTLIETLIAVLHDAGMVEAGLVVKLWRERSKREIGEKEETLRREKLRAQIISAYSGSKRALFEQHVSEGIELLDRKEVARGIRLLERAAALDALNAPLHALVGEHFFESGRTALAIDYLDRTLSSDSENERARLLLGLACGDAGEAERAKELLSDSIRRAGKSFAAHCGLGLLLVAEQKWDEALKEFKGALAARPSAEAHYVTGCAYYQLGRYRVAARHLQKAVEMDGCYVAASYALGLALLRLGENERARAVFYAVCESEDEPRYRSAARRLLRSKRGASANLRVLGINEGAGKGFITGGEKRLARAVCQDALAVKTFG